MADQERLMSFKHWLLIGCGTIALLGLGYLLGRSDEVATAKSQAGHSRKALGNKGSQKVAGDLIDLEIAMVAYSPQGCQMDPSAMGCGLYPIPVVRITNKGDPLQLVKIAVNKRYDDAKCVIAIDRKLSTGDSWMSEGNPTGESENPMAEYARGLRGELVDFRKHCGDQVVFLDVSTDKGVKQYEFGSR